MSTTPDAWTIANLAESAQPLPAEIPAIPTVTPGGRPTDEQTAAVAQHLAATADRAGLDATWHQMDPATVGDHLIAAIRLPDGRVMDVIPRLNRDGMWWFSCHHWTPQGMEEGDWTEFSAFSVEEVLVVARVWRDAPPA